MNGGRLAARLGLLAALLACPLALVCSGVAYGSSHLSAPVRIGNGFEPRAVSCSSASFCAAVGGGGYAAIYSYHQWSTPTVVDRFRHNFLPEQLIAVSCTSPQFCLAVDSYGHALTYTPSGWSEPVALGLGGAFGVGCASRWFCVVVGEAGQAVVYRRGAWSAPTTIDPAGGLNDVACPSARLCVAIDAQGHALTYDGRSWSAPTTVDPGYRLGTVSCPSTAFCMALGHAGGEIGPRNEVTFDGQGWSAPTSIPSSPPGIHDLSCASPALCIAVGFNGQVLAFEDGSWSPISLVADEGPTAVSCARLSFCAIVDLEGRAMTYSPRSRPPTLKSPPFITGEAVVGQTLVAMPGIWTGAPSVYLYTWGVCDSGGANCLGFNYPGERPDRKLFESEVGDTIRFEEWALGAGGTSDPVISPPTCVVRAESEATAPPQCPPGATG